MLANLQGLLGGNVVRTPQAGRVPVSQYLQRGGTLWDTWEPAAI